MALFYPTDRWAFPPVLVSSTKMPAPWRKNPWPCHVISSHGGFLSHGGTPKSSILIGLTGIFPYKPSIFGAPTFMDPICG